MASHDQSKILTMVISDHGSTLVIEQQVLIEDKKITVPTEDKKITAQYSNFEAQHQNCESVLKTLLDLVAEQNKNKFRN